MVRNRVGKVAKVAGETGLPMDREGAVKEWGGGGGGRGGKSWGRRDCYAVDEKGCLRLGEEEVTLGHWVS